MAQNLRMLLQAFQKKFYCILSVHLYICLFVYLYMFVCLFVCLFATQMQCSHTTPLKVDCHAPHERMKQRSKLVQQWLSLHNKTSGKIHPECTPIVHRYCVTSIQKSQLSAGHIGIIS